MANSTDGAIRYSDLIIPDDAVNNLIAQLEKLGQTYGNLVKDIQAQSRQMEQALGKISAATAGGQENIRRMAQEAEKLYEQYTQARQVSTTVQQEIRTVKELEQVINREIGTREQNSRIVGEQAVEIAKLRQFQNQYIKDLQKLEKLQQRIDSGKSLAPGQQQAYEELTKSVNDNRAAYETSNKALAEHTNLRNQARTALSQETKEMQAAEGSIRQLQAQVARLGNAYANMSEEIRQGTAGKELYDTYNNLYAELSRLEQAMGNYRRNVGNYASAWNGLGVSVQQVVRELPSLSMGFDMFFLAISNNLPMLTDEIKAATEAYRQAVAQGNKATPVWKQVLSSIVSWQTALVVGITLLAQYGDQIIDWVKSLVLGRNAALSAEEAQAKLNEEMSQARLELAKSYDAIDKLSSAYNKASGDIDRQRGILVDFAEEVRKATGEVISLADAEDMLSDPNRLNLFKTALEYRTQMLAAEQLKLKAATEAMEKEVSMKNSNDAPWWGKAIANLATPLAAQGYRLFGWSPENQLERFMNYNDKQQADIAKANETVFEELERQAEDNYKKALNALGMGKDDTRDLEYWQDYKAQLQAEYEALSDIEVQSEKGLELRKKIVEVEETINKWDIEDSGKGKKGKKKKTPYDPYQDDLEARRAYEDALGKLIGDEYDRRRYQTTLQYNREIEDMQHRLDTEKNLTEQAQRDLTAQMELIAEQRNAALAQIEKERQVQMLELERQGIEARMQGLNEETEQYRTLQNKLFDVDRRLSLARNEALPAGERQDPQQIAAASNREAAAYNYQFELDRFDEYLEETYDKDYKSEKAKTAMRLRMEKERWEKILQLTEKYGSDVTGYQVGQIKESIGKIDGELSKLGKGWDPEQGVFGNLFDMVLGNPFGDDAKGLDKEQAFKDSISTSVGYAMEALQQFADYKAELADRAVESAEKEVDAAQSVLDAELQARANGYANNVQQAQKELALAKRNQQKALRQQQQAQRQQQAIQAVQQISNLVTATSLLWSQLGLGAIPAVAIMWASFTASKIKAAQLARQSLADMGAATEEYGEGTVELLQGGSHQSGNDIDLGRKPDGTRRRAEGGEFFAVINKRSSRRYRSVIPDVINSLNDGTFAHKYLNAYKGAAELEVELNRGAAQNPDLSALSGDVRAIRRQGDRRAYTDGRGRTVIEYGPHRRRIINNN